MLTRVERRVVSRMAKAGRVRDVVRWLRAPNPVLTVDVMRALGATIGQNVTIKNTVFVDNAHEDENSTGDFSHLTIGDNVYIGDAVYFDLAGEIVLADNSVVAGRASFVTHLDVNRSPYVSEKMPRLCGQVTVGRGASVGFDVTMLAGATLEEEAALAAGALLLQNAKVPSRQIWGGVPAKYLRDL